MPRTPSGTALTGAARIARYRQRQREAGRVLAWIDPDSDSVAVTATGAAFDPAEPSSMLAVWDAGFSTLVTVQRAIKRWFARYQAARGWSPLQPAADRVDEKDWDRLERIKDCDLGGLTRRERPRSRAARWGDAVQELQELLQEYNQWLENLPDSIRQSGSALVEKLEAMGALESAVAEIEGADLPIGWGRD